MKLVIIPLSVCVWKICNLTFKYSCDKDLHAERIAIEFSLVYLFSCTDQFAPKRLYFEQVVNVGLSYPPQHFDLPEMINAGEGNPLLSDGMMRQ